MKGALLKGLMYDLEHDLYNLILWEECKAYLLARNQNRGDPEFFLSKEYPSWNFKKIKKKFTKCNGFALISGRRDFLSFLLNIPL